MSDRVTQAVILAGGAGRRLRARVADRPKPMAEVGGRPFLEWLLLMLGRQGVERAVLCTGYMAEVIEDHFSGGMWEGVEIVCSRETSPLGTGGALRHALDAIAGDRCVVLNGDSYIPVDLVEGAQAFGACDARALMVLTRQDDVSRFGAVDIGPQRQVTAFREKDQTAGAGLINAGVYIVATDLIAGIPRDMPYSLERDLFPDLIGKGLFAMVAEGPFVDIGTPESYDDSVRVLQRELQLLTDHKNDR